MLIKRKLYIWLLVTGCFFLDIGWFSGSIYGECSFKNKAQVLLREKQQCGNDFPCHERVNEQISTFFNQEYQKWSSNDVCLKKLVDAFTPETKNSGSGMSPVNDNYKNEEPLKQNPHEHNITGDMGPKQLPDQCVEIQKLSDELLKLIAPAHPVPSNFSWDLDAKAYHPTPQSYLCDCSKVNETSLRIFSLMEELHTTGSEKQIQDCGNIIAKVTFCKKATVLFNGKWLIEGKDFRIEYKITNRVPAFQLIDFTLAVTSNNIMGFGFVLISESPFVTRTSNQVEFKGDLDVLVGDDIKRIKATEFASETGPFVTLGIKGMTHDRPYLPTGYFAQVDLPRVAFYSPEGWKKGVVYARYGYWPPNDLTPQDLQRALEKGRLTLRGKAPTEQFSGTVTIDLSPSGAGLQTQAQSNPGGFGLWGDRTTHGGFILATGKEVFSDGHPVARAGDPVLCPIHGISKISWDESSGVYIGGRPVAFAGGKTDCGAKIISGSTVKLVRTVKQ